LTSPALETEQPLVSPAASPLNGDGLDDLIVGAYGANPNGIDSGKAYIIFGKTDTNAVDLAKLGADSKYTIDYLGDENANTLTGTRSDEIFVAGAGNDILTGNGGRQNKLLQSKHPNHHH
jgi:hypothetical protein